MRIPLFVLLGSLVCACNPRLIPLPQPTPLPPAAGARPVIVTPGPETEKILTLAIADLSSRFSIDPKEVRLLSIESMLWPDVGLGCPKIGVRYIQVVTPGYQIVLQAKDHTFTFHTDARDRVVLCSVNPPGAPYPTPSSQ